MTRTDARYGDGAIGWLGRMIGALLMIALVVFGFGAIPDDSQDTFSSLPSAVSP